MRIETEVLLDFKDVLIRPKRSILQSRKDVNLQRTFTFKHSGQSWTGVPIMAANMDGVGTQEMALALSEFGMFTCLTKDHEISDFIEPGPNANNFAVSTGTREEDFLNLQKILHCYPEIQFICIDIANGYSEHFGEYVAMVRRTYPEKTIIAGNVVTADMTQELILRGADIIKVGIGGGCFAPGQKVLTDTGYKNVEDIEIGERVLTHTGSFKSVTNTFKFDDKKTIMNVNGIKATPNHEFYVLHKKFKDDVTEQNIHEYAQWISAKDLTKEYFLLKHK